MMEYTSPEVLGPLLKHYTSPESGRLPAGAGETGSRLRGLLKEQTIKLHLRTYVIIGSPQRGNPTLVPLHKSGFVLH